MRVAIVENTEVTHHGQVGVALHERAHLVRIWRPWDDGALPTPDSYDALVVFGGEQSALDDHIHPYLPDLSRLMRSEAAAGRPVLGICLGAQLFARGLGADNHLGTAPEFGWVQVTRTEAADPVLGALPRTFPIFQWHSDTFDLPPGAQHLARSAGAESQAFRFGARGYGMQFHFEASRAMVADWVRRFPDLIDRMDQGFRPALPDLAATLGAKADAHGLQLARAWLDLAEG